MIYCDPRQQQADFGAWLRWLDAAADTMTQAEYFGVRHEIDKWDSAERTCSDYAWQRANPSAHGEPLPPVHRLEAWYAWREQQGSPTQLSLFT